MKRIFLFLLLLVSVESFSQLQRPFTRGYRLRNVIVDSFFALPADTFNVPTDIRDFPHVARKGTTMYVWNTSTVKWDALSTGGGGLSDGDKGDITVSSSGSVWTIDNGVVTNAKLANSTISGVSLGSNLNALTATDATLTFSGSYNGSTARTVGINLSNANTWLADQSVPDDPYDATSWNGNPEAPTKNAIRDKIETISTPTWQQTLTAGSTLSSNNAVSLGSTNFTMTRTNSGWTNMFDIGSKIDGHIQMIGRTSATDTCHIVVNAEDGEAGMFSVVQGDDISARVFVNTQGAFIEGRTYSGGSGTTFHADKTDFSFGGGNVGIGITTPTELLHVVGNAQFGTAGSTIGRLKISGNTSGTVTIQPASAAGTYTLTLPTNDGDASQVLTTDGSGVLSWTTPSGGGGSPAGNYGNLQLNRNGAFDTPASDTLEYETSTGLVVKGNEIVARSGSAVNQTTVGLDDGDNYPGIYFGTSPAVTSASMFHYDAGSALIINAKSGGTVNIRVGNDYGGNQVAWDGSGLVVGGAYGTASTARVSVMSGGIDMTNGTPPGSSITNGVRLYPEDVAASSELKVRDEAGNITVLSPHNFTGIPQGKSEEMAWSFYSEKDGKYVNVDMLKLARLVEKLTGEKLVYTGETKDKPNQENK